MSSSTIRAFVATSLIAILWVVATSLILAPVASAVVCGNHGFLVDSEDATMQRGVRAEEISVINPASECGLVRSTYVLSDSDNFVEVGWFEDGTEGSAAKCDDVLAPHILVYAQVNGFIKCKPGTSALTGGEDYSFRVDNPDHDFDFVYYWDDDTSPDISLGFYEVDFSHGFAQFASERHGPSDSLKADILGVNSLGSGGNWHNLESPIDLDAVGNTSGWEVDSWSSHHLIVRAS